MSDLDKIFSERWNEIWNYTKLHLYTRRSKIEAEELISELYLYLYELEDKKEEDYIKLAKTWIKNQLQWSTKSKLPKSDGKNVKSKLKLIGDELTPFIGNNLKSDDYEDLDKRIDFGLYIESKLERSEKILFKLYFVERLSHKKIAQRIRDSGIKISDSSIYNSIVHLRVKLKSYKNKFDKL